jgi:hypothetical protein
MAAAGGRWLVEECQASASNGVLALRLGGLGWKWVNEARDENRVRQHVYFSATVDLEGSLQLAYDPRSRVASVFMLPKTEASVSPALPVRATAENFVGGFLDLFVDADEYARAAVATEGSSQFRQQLSQGITVTFDVARAQPDVNIGPRLPAGMVPSRPFHGNDPWLLNERQALHQGGLLVAGPYPPGVPALLDVVVEGGGPLRFRVACRDAVVDNFHGFYRGLSFIPIVQLQDSGWVVPGKRVTETVPPQPCPWVLVTAAATSPSAIATVYAAVQVRPGR